MFTCAIDTGELIWDMDGNQFYFSTSQVPNVDPSFSFTFSLTSTQGANIVSTATIDNVHLDDNGTVITCGDSSVLQLANIVTIKLAVSSGIYHNKLDCVCISSYTGPPKAPLNVVKYCFNLSSVAISWVAPLDTPLCVHSYTVTVRNSCNSSQVMVYNTTDKRSSLSITDLTSDGEYSVTVAGRDGAGRLGQESEKLNISSYLHVFPFSGLISICEIWACFFTMSSYRL